jgi:hypothetical protein
MSNRNFDNRAIIQRLQQKNYARNLYQNNVSGQTLINNPQNTNGNSSEFNTYHSGAQTMYFRGLLGGGETVNVGGIFGIPPRITSTVSVPSATVPGPPTITSITSGNQQLTVVFTAGSDGGSPITDYEYSTNNGATFISAGTTVSPIVISGLVNGTTYQVVIRAVNVNGPGAHSDEVDGTTIPGAPTILFIIPRDTELEVWFTPGLNGGYSITDYLYSLNGGIFISSERRRRPITITGLSNGTPYSVEIKAVNSIGIGAVSNSVSNTPYLPVDLYYDPNNLASYPGSGTTVNNVGTAPALTGTINDTLALTWINGSGGAVGRKVFDFNGGAKIAYGSYNFSDYITINVWIYPGSGFSINTILANAVSGYPVPGIKAGWNSFGNLDYKMIMEAGNNSGQESVIQTNANVVTPNTWQFLTYVLNNNNHTISLYKNSSSLISFEPIVNDIAVSGPFNIGWMLDENFGMIGQLGYIKIYDGILSDAQIAAEFNTSKASFGL